MQPLTLRLESSIQLAEGGAGGIVVALANEG